MRDTVRSKPLVRILYVEDEADIRLVVKLALEAVGGFQVVACASGDHALQVAPQARADLLLLDVMMPGMDGIRTLRSLRRVPETAATPAVFMTAKVQREEMASFKAAGALDVIAKPFDPITLPARLREIWAQRREVARPGTGE